MNSIQELETRVETARDAIARYDAALVVIAAGFTAENRERWEALATEQITTEAQRRAAGNVLADAERQLQDAREFMQSPGYRATMKQLAKAEKEFTDATQAARDAMQTAADAMRRALDKHAAYKKLVRQDISITRDEQTSLAHNADYRYLQDVQQAIEPYLRRRKLVENVKQYILGFIQARR